MSFLPALILLAGLSLQPICVDVDFLLEILALHLLSGCSLAFIYVQDWLA